MPATLTDAQNLQVLRALAQLSRLATVKQISEAAGFEVTLPLLKPLVSVGHVAMTEVKEPPVMRLTITAAGRKWMEAQNEGTPILAPVAMRPADGPLGKGSPEITAELYRRFGLGEGSTYDSLRQLAVELNISIGVVSGCRGSWQKKQGTQPPGHPVASPASTRLSSKKRAQIYALFAEGMADTKDGQVEVATLVELHPQQIADYYKGWEKAGRPGAPAVPAVSSLAPAPQVPETNAERLARLHARFAAGEGTTAESKKQLAGEFGLTPMTIAAYLTDWRKAQKVKAETGVDPATRPPATTKMSPDTRQELYARFAAGEADTDAERLKLADYYGIQPCTIEYHLRMWKKAGCPGKAPAITPALAPVVDAAEPDETLTDGDALVFSDDKHDREIEHQTTQPQHGSQDEVIDPSAGPVKIEQTGGHGEPAAITVQSAVITPGAPEEMVVRVEGTAAGAPSTPMAESSTAGQGSSTSTAPMTTNKPVTALAEAMMKAGLVTPDQVIPVAPARRLTCHVCHKPCDPIFWVEDTKKGLSGHKECVSAAPDPEPEERLPEEGSVYEGTVGKVDSSGMFALVDLTEFYSPGERKWLRGKVTRSEVLRHGFCSDVRSWLQVGDVVNVMVLKVDTAMVSGKRRVDLSIKQAPAHPNERVPLEKADRRQGTAELPISARGEQIAGEQTTVLGMQLSSQIIATYQVDEIREARHLALGIIRAHRLDESQLVNLVERILTNGIAQTTEEVEAEVAAAAGTGTPPAVQPFGTMLERVHQLALEKEELVKRISRLEEQLAEAERSKVATAGANRLLESELAEAKEQAARAEANANMAVEVNETLRKDLNLAKTEALTAEMQVLASERELKRHALGICAACLHGIDGMCPYTDAVEPSFELPDENKHERHHGKAIVFGPRRVVSCDLSRPASQLETAAD